MGAKLLAYFGHHKCASQYIQAIVRNVCEYLDLSLEIETVPKTLPNQWHLKDEYRRSYPNAIEAISRFDFDFICHGNAEVDLLDVMAHRDYRGFHVVRDPRDMLVSGYFSHKNSHNVSKAPWMAEHRQRLRRVGLEEGLKLELDYSSVYFDALARWNYGHPQVYETNFETLVRQPHVEFTRIFQFLGITISPIMPRILSLKRSIRKRVLGSEPERRVLPKSKLNQFVTSHSFEKESGGRRPGVENQGHHYRKGTPGDWKTHFFPELCSRFKDRYGDLLIKLGYEAGFDW